MTSLDVENLFTNNSLDEIIEKLYKQPFFNDDPVPSLIKKDFKKLLKFASYESLFTFDNKYYFQWDGAAMGFSLEPTLSNAFLCHFEKYWLSDWPQDFCPNILRKYVGIPPLRYVIFRGGSRAAATSKMEWFVLIVDFGYF